MRRIKRFSGNAKLIHQIVPFASLSTVYNIMECWMWLNYLKIYKEYLQKLIGSLQSTLHQIIINKRCNFLYLQYSSYNPGQLNRDCLNPSDTEPTLAVSFGLLPYSIDKPDINCSRIQCFHVGM